jgi:hypothetical protein
MVCGCDCFGFGGSDGVVVTDSMRIALNMNVRMTTVVVDVAGVLAYYYWRWMTARRNDDVVALLLLSPCCSLAS